MGIVFIHAAEHVVQVAIMRRSLFRRWLLVLAVVILFCTGCGLLSRKVQVGEEFTIRPKEKVSVAGTGIGIRLDVVGHQWYIDKRSDAPYVELTITGGGASSRSLALSESANVGDYNCSNYGLLSLELARCCSNETAVATNMGKPGYE